MLVIAYKVGIEFNDMIFLPSKVERNNRNKTKGNGIDFWKHWTKWPPPERNASELISVANIWGGGRGRGRGRERERRRWGAEGEGAVLREGIPIVMVCLSLVYLESIEWYHAVHCHLCGLSLSREYLHLGPSIYQSVDRQRWNYQKDGTLRTG